MRPRGYRGIPSGTCTSTRCRTAPSSWASRVSQVHELVRAGELDAAAGLLPEERPYPVADGMPAQLPS